MKHGKHTGTYGMLAEFDSPTQILAAARKVRAAGYKNVEAYTPFPIEELSHELGHHHSWVPYICLAGGITGALVGFGLCYWTSVIAYPMNIGGRPLNSWPSFIPVTYECTILFAAFSAVIGMMVLNGLPEPHHPLFNSERFALASRDRYFLCVEAKDPKFDPAATRTFLQGLHASEVSDVAF